MSAVRTLSRLDLEGIKARTKELLRNLNHSYAANISLWAAASKPLKTSHLTAFVMPRCHSRHAGWAETLQRRRHLYSNRNPEPPATSYLFSSRVLDTSVGGEEFRRRVSTEVGKTEKRRKEKKDSQSSSRCNVIASDSTSLPSTTADRAATFAPSARACSSRRSLWCWVSSFPDVLRLRSSASWEDGGGSASTLNAKHPHERALSSANRICYVCVLHYVAVSPCFAFMHRTV